MNQFPFCAGPTQAILNPHPPPTQVPPHIREQCGRASQPSQIMMNPTSIPRIPPMNPPSLPHAPYQNTMNGTPISTTVSQRIMNQPRLPTAPPQHMMDRLSPPFRHISDQMHPRHLPPPLSQNFFDRTHDGPTAILDKRSFALSNVSDFYTDVTTLIASLKGKRGAKLMRIRELQARRQGASKERLWIMNLPDHKRSAEQNDRVRALYAEISSSGRLEAQLAYKSCLLKKMITELKALRTDSPAAAGDQMYLISKIIALKAHDRINKNVYERLVCVMENLFGRIAAFYLPPEPEEESDYEIEPMPSGGDLADPYDSDV